ncbi:MAG: glycosyltransferase family 2 protein [Clostridia bacterium]|nr:glycosyltransferase family 2 protein [Clostridia bacterium]
MVPVIIPAYEPGAALTDYCRRLLQTFDTVVVMDDGSGDAYRAVFDEIGQLPGCIVLHHEQNRGKGRSLKDAFQYVLDAFPQAAGCVTADSDGQHLCEDVYACAQAFEQHPDHLVLGARDFSKADIPPRNLYGNRILKTLYRRLIKMDLQDTQTGLRVYPRAYMQICVTVKGERFDFENRALLAADEHHVPILEHPIETVYAKREDYVSHYAPVRDSLTAYAILFAAFFRRLFTKRK